MIAIIDYKLGNLASVQNALNSLNVESVITDDPQKISKADKIILLGVGAFGEGINNLKKANLIPVLNQEVLVNKKPFLGICLGMQLICKKGYEGGEYDGLGWIDAEVVKFDSTKLRVPHIGWNDVVCNLNSPIFKGGNEVQTFYFVHSFFVKPADQSIVIGKCHYGVDFTAVIQKDNIFAAQFHPEKSQHEGLEILRKFSEIKTC